jgi:hypothetical protein
MLPPPATAVQEDPPVPFEVKTYPLVPFVVGNVVPPNVTAPASVRLKILAVYALLIISRLPVLFNLNDLLGLVAPLVVLVAFKKSKYPVPPWLSLPVRNRAAPVVADGLYVILTALAAVVAVKAESPVIVGVVIAGLVSVLFVRVSVDPVDTKY